MYTILIVEDEAQIADIVKEYLQREGYTVRHVADITTALSIVGAETDLIVLDLMLPDGQGEILCKHVAERYNTPVIILTSKRSEQSRINGFAAGADDYLTKPFSPRELVARVKSILKRAKPHDNIIRLENGITIYPDRRGLTKNSIEIKLTPNEYKVFLCLVNNLRKIVSRDTLVECINSPDAVDRIIDVHIRHLRQKLEDNPKHPTIIKTVHGYGYTLGVKCNA
ncbi:MAG: response regulator transcription factor [Desulfovibrio sp.]|jgi:DNA-binding response OmpR family regulator|nr:response regulator transcription factor [Desulfovibrio sp.]